MAYLDLAGDESTPLPDYELVSILLHTPIALHYPISLHQNDGTDCFFPLLGSFRGPVWRPAAGR